MTIIVEQLWPGDQAPGTWKKIGEANSMDDAVRIAKRHHDPKGFGGFRHPDGGLRYGTIRAVVDGETALFYDAAAELFI